MAKFAISEISLFYCTDVSTDTFTYTNNLMQCLIVTIMCCVDDHFTSFVAVLLTWFAVNFVLSYVQYLGKIACHVYRIGY